MWFWRRQGKSEKEKGKGGEAGALALWLVAFTVATLSGCSLFAPREEVQSHLPSCLSVLRRN